MFLHNCYSFFKFYVEVVKWENLELHILYRVEVVDDNETG